MSGKPRHSFAAFARHMLPRHQRVYDAVESRRASSRVLHSTFTSTIAIRVLLAEADLTRRRPVISRLSVEVR